MMFRPFILPFAILAAGTVGMTALAAGAASPTPSSQAALPPPPPGPGLDLINERCGFCHTTAQVLNVRKTPANWAISVQAMIDRGAELTNEEQQVVVDYLTTNRGPDSAGTTATVTASPPTGKPAEPAKH